jgi:hypothetical protein
LQFKRAIEFLPRAQRHSDDQKTEETSMDAFQQLLKGNLGCLFSASA